MFEQIPAPQREKRAAVINDLSGFGRCSIGVTLPILFVMGVHTASVPTAVLSTHTGNFTGYSFRDLTGDMGLFLDHWQKEQLQFDALMSGYLGSYEQIEIVQEYFRVFGKEDNLVFVDPVMGDDGELYALYTSDMAAGMKKLCAGADVIVPNLTEACILLGETYREHHQTEQYLHSLCRGLKALGARRVVITGASTVENRIGAACLDDSGFYMRSTVRVPASYCGTGDVFASVLLGALLNDKDLPSSVQLAADYTALAVRRSVENAVPAREGVDFERDLWKLGREVCL